MKKGPLKALTLQACIYKSVKTGLFLKSFVATSVFLFNIVVLFCQTTWYLKVKTSISILSLTTYGARIDYQNRLFLQTCKYRPVKRLWHWLLEGHSAPWIKGQYKEEERLHQAGFKLMTS